jgi:hypothetical protein
MEIGIDEFGSEGENGPEGVNRSEGENGFTVNGAVRVGEVLARSTPIHWDEAVALLQELIDTLTSTNRDDVPGFDDVFIDADGVVTVHGRRRGERGPVAAGHALHSLLATADVPVALRLFVTQATAPDTHESLKAFAEGLAYFGKSGRSELVRAVYDRYRVAGGGAPAPTRPRTSSPPDVPPAVQKAAFTPPVRPRKRVLPRWAFPAAVVAVAVSAISVVWLSMGNANSVISGSGEAAADVPAEAPALNAATTPAASSTPARPQAPVTMTSSAAAQTAADPPRRIGAAPLSTSPSREGTDTNSARVPQIISFETLRAPTMPPSFDSSASRPAVVTDRRERTIDVDSAKTIYSRDDTDVQPPVMLYPQMPPPLIVGGPPEGIVNSMELVIAPDGSVERVRLVSTPRRMADMMLLSGAKLWKFAPAVKNGEPVRYRTTLSWTVFP